MAELKTIIEVWSDVICPFCYIGKRHLEAAIEKLSDPARTVEVIWKSFQLDPGIPEFAEGEAVNVYQYLAERKGISHEQSKAMHQQINEIAANANLKYHFDQTVVANSFKAHRLLQLAKERGLADSAEELLFSAYFIEGKNIADVKVLESIGMLLDLQAEDVQTALTSESYAYAVQKDIDEASQVGVSGVPFFVFNRKYALSGAQPVEQFVQAIEQAGVI